jgi:hypothetical protein
MLSPLQSPPDRVVPVAPRAVRPGALPGPVRGPIRLPLRRRLGVYVVAAGLWASGALWLVFHHFVRGKGEFGPTISPLEPWWLRLHGAAAFGFLWIFGLLWGVHMVNGWTAGRRRWSGGVMFAAAVFLIVSGYLLYYAGGEDLRALASAAHWIVGLAAPVAFVWHRYLARDRG